MLQTLPYSSVVGPRGILEIFKIHNSIGKLPSVISGSFNFPELVYGLTFDYHVLGLRIDAVTS